MGTRAPGGGTPDAATRSAALADVLDELAALGQRVCRWPACHLPAVGTGARGPDAPSPTPAAGGRPAEYCSEAHRRSNGRAVATLRALHERTAALRAQAPLREHRAVDAALADIGRRLALHGEPPPAAYGQVPAAPAHDDTSSGRAGTRHEGARASGLPVLALPSGETDHQGFAVDYEWLRDMNDRTRHLVDRFNRAPGDPHRQRLAADHWRHLADLAEAVDQVVTAVVRIRR